MQKRTANEENPARRKARKPGRGSGKADLGEEAGRGDSSFIVGKRFLLDDQIKLQPRARVAEGVADFHRLDAPLSADLFHAADVELLEEFSGGVICLGAKQRHTARAQDQG